MLGLSPATLRCHVGAALAVVLTVVGLACLASDPGMLDWTSPDPHPIASHQYQGHPTQQHQPAAMQAPLPPPPALVNSTLPLRDSRAPHGRRSKPSTTG